MDLNEDKWAEEVARKWMRRSGIRRIYIFEDIHRDGRLELEFVIRGRVLFRLRLWKIASLDKKVEKRRAKKWY